MGAGQVQGRAGFQCAGDLPVLSEGSYRPELEVYVTPVNIDPGRPDLPISHPVTYSIYLANLFGPYATLGLAEDTWALNEEVLDDHAFLVQCYGNHEDRERMFFDALEKTPQGLCACVFDTTDRVQHMFWRYLEEGHPAAKGVPRTAAAGDSGFVCTYG